MAEKMKLSDRAKIFLPFDALKGFREALKEKERIKVDKKTLSSYRKEEIMNTLNKLKKGMMVNVEYYNHEEMEYFTIKGILTNIDYTYKSITIVKTIILMTDIYSINIDGEEAFIFDN